MYYLKEFATHNDYESYINNNPVLPNVSICDDETNSVYYKPVLTYEAVDLGLPSGLKWAKCNIGAETETEYGDYFMWGSTTPDTNNTCDWAHAPFNNGQRECDLTYFNAHKSEWLTDEDILKPEYDAAHVIMGGDWRIPTKADWDELIDNTTNEWVENYQNSGVDGRLFTSNINGNILFFPPAGYREDSSFHSPGNRGYVWNSSILLNSSYYAWYLVFYNNYCNILDNSRYLAQSIRGVCE